MGKYNIKEHKDEIITHVVKNIIWLPIAATIPLINAVIGSLKQNFFTQDSVFVIVLSVLSFLLSLLAVLIALKDPFKKKHNKSVTNESAILPIALFRVKSVETELFFENRTDITSTVSYDLIANEDGVRYFQKEIIWSGQDYFGTDLVECNGNYSFEITDNNNSLHTYKVLFNDPVKCQDNIKFKTVTKVADSTSKMQPVSSYMVKHQIDLLTIRVVVPRGLIKNVRKSIYADLARQVKIEPSSVVDKKNIGSNDVYEITIKNPTLLYRYYLEWEFTK